MTSAVQQLGFDPSEIEWLLKHPDFEERPATLSEFLGPYYLNIEDGVRRRIREELVEIMGEEVSGERPTAVSLALITGGIGIGKTTVASIVLPYLAHWALCLKDPQDFFGLLPGSRIAFMQMSTSEQQALEVVFGDIKARIQHSPWFQKYPWDPKLKNQLRFAKDIWIIPGDSAETTFEGYNILGGILEEGDSHKLTENKDYAEQGYDTISNRITSRFQDRGFLLIIGQMKRSTGFMSKMYKRFKKDPNAYAVRLAIWDAMDRELYEDEKGDVEVFTYDIQRKMIVPNGVTGLIGSNDTLLEIPVLYLPDFKNNPEKALKDLAGIPPLVTDAFISMTHKITAARDRWVEHNGDQSPVGPDGRRLAKWFTAPNTLKRVCHIDIAYAGGGDALGFAMGHVIEMVEIEEELKPYIVIDMLARFQAPPGQQVFLGDMRQMVYSLRNDLGFRLVKATLDGFESTDTMQQFQRRRIEAEYLSVDKQMLPYEDLREAIYEDRIEFPPFMADVRTDNGVESLEILYKELSELQVTDKNKVDHPVGGSKDVADAVAGVTSTLMGDRRFQKRTKMMAFAPGNQRYSPALGGGHHPAIQRDFEPPAAPLPPSLRV